MIIDSSFSWWVADEYEVYTSNDPEKLFGHESSSPEQRLDAYLEYDRDIEAFKADNLRPFLFIAPSPECEWPRDFTRKTLSGGDSSPHIDLLNIDPADPIDCFEFIDKWGLLGGGLKFRDLHEDRSFDRPLTLSEVRVLPERSGQMEKQLSNDFQSLEAEIDKFLTNKFNIDTSSQTHQKEKSFTIPGKNYFGEVLLQAPKKYNCPESWLGGTDTYSLDDFPAWDSYGEWLQLPLPYYYRDDAESKSVFNYAVRIFQDPLTDVSPFPFFRSQNNDDRRFKPRIESSLATNQNTSGSSSYGLKPRTLFDACLLLMIKTEATQCLYCAKWNAGNQKFCSRKCKDRFSSHKRQQTKRSFKQNFLEEKYPEYLRTDNKYPNYPERPSGNLYHPAELLPDTPLNPEPEPRRCLTDQELEIAKEWVNNLHTTSSRKDLLKQLIKNFDPQDL